VEADPWEAQSGGEWVERAGRDGAYRTRWYTRTIREREERGERARRGRKKGEGR